MTSNKTILTFVALIAAVGFAIWAIKSAGLGCTASCYAPATSTKAQ